MISLFTKYIADRKLFSKKDRLVLAISGGVDSVVLADLCHKAGFSFVLAHMNFNLRAEESARDEMFVRELASRLGVNLFVEQVDTGGYASANNVSIQVAARELRYAWFEKLRQQQVESLKESSTPAAAFIVTAHHADDSVETMLMNLFRGTGITGLRGILPIQNHLVRPMLSFTKDEILTYATAHNLAWVEDSSNQLDKYTRNYFRNQVIPMLRNIYPQVDQNLYGNLDRFNDAAILYRESVDRKIKRLVLKRDAEFHIPVLRLQKTPAFATILLEIIQPFGFTANQLQQVVNLLESETGRQVIAPLYRIIKNRNWLIIAPIAQEEAALVVIEENEPEIIFSKGKLKLDIIPFEKIAFKQDKPGIPVDSDTSVAYIDTRKIQFPLMLRRAKPGDYFYPLGMKKKKKVARLLIDAKLSKTAKESVWVIESNQKIIWVVGLRIDDRFKLTPATNNVLRMRLI